MDWTERLGLWGSAYAAARAAERAAAQQSSSTDRDLCCEAQLLRARADRLHREIYTELGQQRHRA